MGGGRGDVTMLRIRRFLAWMAINLVTGLATITLAIWWMAYVSPAQSIMVMVDRFGEAAAELVLIPIVWAVVTLGLYYAVERLLPSESPDRTEPIPSESK